MISFEFCFRKARMGCDIYTTLGRIKPLAIGHTRSSTALVIEGLSKEPLDFSQFEFMDYCENCRDNEPESDSRYLFRDYDLFSWLAAIRGDLAPVVENMEKLKGITSEFTRWANKEDRRIKDEEAGLEEVTSPGWFSYHGSWRDNNINGDHSLVLYPLLFLKGYDYSAPVRVRPKGEYDDLAFYLKRVEEFQGKTYRDIFPDYYFAFVDWAIENRWDFVIFSFD